MWKPPRHSPKEAGGAPRELAPLQPGGVYGLIQEQAYLSSPRLWGSKMDIRTGVAAALALGGILIASASVAQAQTPPPVEAYGRLPAVSGVAISPDGQRLIAGVAEGDASARRPPRDNGRGPGPFSTSACNHLEMQRRVRLTRLKPPASR